MAKEKTEKEKQYGASLNLPHTDFPMRGNLPKKEPEWVKLWHDIDIYNKVNAKNEGKEKFILHDGPPYANGDLHLGHTMNKVLKDMIVKYKSMNGFDSPYIPGWDTHGLPIELKAIENVGLDLQTEDKVAFREACADYAMKYVDIQSKSFQRLGVRGDFEHPYLTLDPKFEAEEIGVFGSMAQKGYIYKGTKPVHWCPSCETALAEAEIEYGDERSPSIYVKFPVKDTNGHDELKDAYFLIWTTTPWTLPANEAIALNPDFDYELCEFNNEKYVIAKELVEKVIEDAELSSDYQVLATWKGKDLERVVCSHPFANRDSLVILGSHVTLDAGTGCVHTAPGHGQEDYVVAQKYDLPILSPLNDKGYLTKEAGIFAGLSVNDANKAIGEWLSEHDYLVHLSFINHQYPHCWRCKSSTLFRATSQWFASIDGFREEALDQIENHIQFIPSWGKERIGNMIRDRGDWCISRQRIWGVPIPVFYCEDCSEIIMNEETIGHVQELFKEHGSNIWFAKEAEDLLPEGYTCPKCHGTHFRKETDIMDVWFDSGSSHMGVLKVREGQRWPADLYLEGSDQHRGWFNSSLCTSVALFGKAPYKALLTHGFTVDEQGRKMSKSLGNGIDPAQEINKRGADILRLWVASVDYRGDVSISDNILKQIAESYRKIRNTFRYLLGSLFDYDAEQDRVPYENLKEVDQWLLAKLNELIENITEAFDNYDFHIVYRNIFDFCNETLSAFYVDMAKDRLYANEKAGVDRRSVQTVLYDTLLALDTMLTPVLAFTSEEVFSYIKMPNKPESVQLLDWPQVDESKKNAELLAKWAKLLAVRDEVTKPLEDARKDKIIGNSLDAKVYLYVDEPLAELFSTIDFELQDLFIVSQIEVLPLTEAPANSYKSENMDLAVLIKRADGEKCMRCWKYTVETYKGIDDNEVCKRCADVLEKESK